MTDNDIEKMDRHALRDRLLVIQKRIIDYTHAARKNFEFAMSMDKEKELIEKRLSELEDFQTHKPTNMFVSADGD